MNENKPLGYDVLERRLSDAGIKTDGLMTAYQTFPDLERLGNLSDNPRIAQFFERKENRELLAKLAGVDMPHVLAAIYMYGIGSDEPSTQVLEGRAGNYVFSRRGQIMDAFAQLPIGTNFRLTYNEDYFRDHPDCPRRRKTE